MVAILVGSGVLAAPVAAETGRVTGSLSIEGQTTLTAAAVAVVTIIDQTACPDAGVMMGEQRIDAPGAVRIGFSVLYDTDRVDPTHSYALLATITDGQNTWQNHVPTPIVTGGATNGIDLTLEQLPSDLPAAATGTLTIETSADLSSSAVEIAALINQESGAIVNRYVSSVPDDGPITFSIGYDPDPPEA